MTKIAESETTSGFSNSVWPLQPQPRSPVQFPKGRKKDAQKYSTLMDEKDKQFDLDCYFPCHYFDYIAESRSHNISSSTLLPRYATGG